MPQKTKYRVKKDRKTIYATDSYPDVLKYVRDYMEEHVETDIPAIKDMMTNIYKGKPLFHGIEVSTNPMLKIFENRKLIEEICERDVYIDRFIRFVMKASDDLKDYAEAMSIAKMNLQMLVSADPILKDILNHNDLRKIALANVVGVLKSAFEGDLNIHSVDDSDEITNFIKNKKRKDDMDVLYR